tara:strand:- start:3416 stop:3814 length:399 start_codon:yes stop_codon:yes gene_type:complete
MSKSVNMERLIQNLDNRFKNKINLTNNIDKKELYLPLTDVKKDVVDSNYSYLNKIAIIKPKIITNQSVKVVKEKIDYLSSCKKYILIFFIFIILSHSEFDYITNIDNMTNLYKIMLKALIFIIILMILNIFT